MMKDFIDNLMQKMTVAEKIGQLNLAEAGSLSENALMTGTAHTQDLEQKIIDGQVGAVLNMRGPSSLRRLQELAAERSPHGIPLIFGLDVIHGHRLIFPIPLGLSCTWDPALIEATAHVAGADAAADGIKWVFSPMVDIPRDPRWGRYAEGSGEDPYLGGQIAAAMVRGYQGQDLAANDRVMACVKHFAGGGLAERGLDYHTVDMSRTRLMNEVLPPFREAVDAGAGSMMTALNPFNGEACAVNKTLMTDIARKLWNFRGFFTSDYSGLHETASHGHGGPEINAPKALKAGLDMDMVSEVFLKTLPHSLREAKVTEAEIDAACRRVLEAKFKLGLFTNPFASLDEERAAASVRPADRRLARDAVARACVLLKNDNNALPLQRLGSIALIGPLADDRANMPGTWAVSANAADCVTVLEGLRAAAGGKANILYAKGANIVDDPSLIENLNTLTHCVDLDPRPPAEMIAEAVAVARRASVIVAVVGEAIGHSGEARTRTEIDIPSSQRPLLDALSAVAKESCKPLILVVMSGRPLTLGWECEHADSVLMSWHGGTETGNGIADLLFGDYNPSGKLTATFPRSLGQIPIYYNHERGGRPHLQDTFQQFAACPLDGPISPQFPFGFGLSYTHFDYGPMSLSKSLAAGRDKVRARINITNTGGRAGEEIVQLYISARTSSLARPVKELKGFRKITLQQGETQLVEFEIAPKDLGHYLSDKKFGWEPGEFEIHIGPNSRDVQTANLHWEKRRSPKVPTSKRAI